MIFQFWILLLLRPSSSMCDDAVIKELTSLLFVATDPDDTIGHQCHHCNFGLLSRGETAGFSPILLAWLWFHLSGIGHFPLSAFSVFGSAQHFHDGGAGWIDHGGLVPMPHGHSCHSSILCGTRFTELGDVLCLPRTVCVRCKVGTSRQVDFSELSSHALENHPSGWPPDDCAEHHDLPRF